MASSPKIVITGTGAVCSAGSTAGSIWEALKAGASALGPVERWDSTGWEAPLGGEIAESNRTLVPDRKLHKSISRTDMFGLYAADQAVQQSGLLQYRDSLGEDAVPTFNDRSGVIAGSGGGGFDSTYDYLPLIAEVDADLPSFGRELGNMVTPMWLLKNLPNNVLCHVGIRYQFKGTNACITNHCVSGSLAVAESAESIRSGEADRMTAVGHDAPLEPESVHYHRQAGLLSGEGLFPFDAQRSGTVFGDGAAGVVLETEEAAQARGATILGEFLGSGCVSEGAGVLSIRPDGDGVARAIRMALADAGLQPGDIGMICAHGNGTPASDASEALGIQRVFGEAIPPVTGFKWAFGHLIAGSGLLDFVLSLEALREGVVPGIPTLQEADATTRFLPLSREAQAPTGKTALTICRGFGGMNVVLVIGSCTG